MDIDNMNDEEMERFFKDMFPQYDTENPEFDDYWEQYGNRWEWEQWQAYAIRMAKAHGLEMTGLFRDENAQYFEAGMFTWKGWN